MCRQGKRLAARRRQQPGKADMRVLKQECDALRLLLNQIRSETPKIPDEAHAWAEKQ